jgi:uncharacterized protein
LTPRGSRDIFFAHMLHRSRLIRTLLIALGSVSVGLAVLGIFLPILPTTPFLLLAAWCYARSSRRFYVWLMTHRIWGKYLRDYTSGKGVPLRLKMWTLTLLWAAIFVSAFLVVEKTWVRVLLIVIACGVSIHILRIRTMKNE